MIRRRGLIADRPIVTRLVLRVAAAMTLVLVAAGAFVFWRVQYALNRQLDQDLQAYRQVVEKAVGSGATPASGTPGQSYQLYDSRGRIVGGNADTRLLSPVLVHAAAVDGVQREDVGRLLPPSAQPYRVVAASVRSPDGDVVVATAISRAKRDEALWELLLQLLIADLATLAAASLVGYATVRAALNPVERFRLAAERAGDHEALWLPVNHRRNDEITRLVHTFNDLLARLGRANARERRFLADASHELRAPLTLMRTELEWALLRRDKSGDAVSDPETSQALQSMRDQVERLIGLSNALLDLEEVGATAPPRRPVDMSRLITAVADRFTRRAAALGRRIVYRGPADLTVCGHQRWLDLAVDNLVANALGHGEGTVTVSASREDATARIAVSDEGPGFPAVFVAEAFDRFTRAQVSRTTPGTGLGLALVRAVAEAHGGKAQIEGASVILERPAVDQQQTELEGAPT
jgi:signal transduction histidine kinase